MEIGKYSYYNSDTLKLQFADCAKLYVGKFCSIAANLTVYLGGNHRSDWITTYPFGHIHQETFNSCKSSYHQRIKWNWFHIRVGGLCSHQCPKCKWIGTVKSSRSSNNLWTFNIRRTQVFFLLRCHLASLTPSN